MRQNRFTLALAVAALLLALASLTRVYPPAALAQSGGSSTIGAINVLTDTIIDVDATSNGTTAVTVGPAAIAGKRVYVARIFITNTGGVIHPVTVQSSGGTRKNYIELGPYATAVIDDYGLTKSAVGEALQVKIDTGGSAGDVIVTGTVVQK